MNYRTLPLLAALLCSACVTQPADDSDAPRPQPSAPQAQSSAPAAPAVRNDPKTTANPDVRMLRADQIEIVTEQSALVRSLTTKVRQRLMLPAGKYPASTQVTVQFKVSPQGRASEPQILKSSGYRSVDMAVLEAIGRAQPLPVLQSWITQGQGQQLKLVFRPYERR